MRRRDFLRTGALAAAALPFVDPFAAADEVQALERRGPSQRIIVVGAGLDRTVSLAESERLAEWLDAGYEPFAAHSHYGLVVGENSYQQVADAIRVFLEVNRL